MKKVKDEISILDAVDILSSIAEIDIIESTQRVKEEEKEFHSSLWTETTNKKFHEELVEEAFNTVKLYLKQIYEKDPEQLKERETKKGFQALIVLIQEAVEKIEKFTELFKDTTGKTSLKDLKQYVELMEFYSSTIIPHLPSITEAEDSWEEELNLVEEKVIQLRRRGLSNLSDMKKDVHYELFYLKGEDGVPFYDYDLVRHIKLLCDFDELVWEQEGEDIFLKIKIFEDKNSHLIAKEILKNQEGVIEEFYKEALKYKESEFVSSINKALMALMLSANPRNLLLSSAGGKTSQDYFSDFHFFLRKAFSSPEYQALVREFPQRKESFQNVLYQLIHKLCLGYFLSIKSHKEMAALIQRLVKKGKNVLRSEFSNDSKKQTFWENLITDDACLRGVLKQYPNGPLRKIIDLFQNQEQAKGFDPLSIKNIPSKIFSFSNKEREIISLRLPAPIIQHSIDKVEIASEFEGALRSISLENDSDKLLLINLQDRTSWDEHARAVALEALQSKKEFCSLVVVTFPKNTDFYHQNESYEGKEEDARTFLDQIKQQVVEGEQCGFYFPSLIDKDKLFTFTNLACQSIHEIFFEGRKRLSRNERGVFLEIFYLFLTLKCIELSNASYISYTCKDALDTSPTANATLYSYLRLVISSDEWSDAEKDFLHWMLYAPALIMRERIVDKFRFQKVINTLTVIQKGLEKHRDRFEKAYKNLFSFSTWKKLKILS